ncbi:MAG: class II fructose-bisphosphate aldolase [Ruthenibacterium sp.]|jgi:ketose-bisphosphate aldolase
MTETMTKIWKLSDILRPAQTGGFAVGSFSPRYTKLIRPIVQAGMALRSPLIVQISEKEIYRHKVDIRAFAEEFYRVCRELEVDIPITLHLDHTKDFEVIRQAVACGFTSVMIDASEWDFEENAARTKRVVEFAHSHGVSVEAELGKIGTTDFVETDKDEEQYTVPQEAEQFCMQTGVDALAVSVGTAHGVYTVRQPKIAYDRLEAINRLTGTPLVLHGGSGVPSEMVVKAVQMPTGGVCKVNIATDIELAMLGVVGRTGHMTEAELNACPAQTLQAACCAVETLVKDRIANYLLSEGKADLYAAQEA